MSLKPEGVRVGGVKCEDGGLLGVYVLDVFPSRNFADPMTIASMSLRLGLPGLGLVMRNVRLMRGRYGAWLAFQRFKVGKRPISTFYIEDEEVQNAICDYVMGEMKKYQAERIEELGIRE